MPCCGYEQLVKGVGSRNLIIGSINKIFETPAVNQFCFLNAISFYNHNYYLLYGFIPQNLGSRPLVTGRVAYNFVISNCIINNKGVWLIKLCIVHVKYKFYVMHCC